MHQYIAFGLNVDADLPLPELLGRDGSEPPDVVVRYGDLGAPPPAEALTNRRLVRSTEKGVYVFWDFIGAVLVRSGCEIIADPLPGVEDRAVRLVTVGIALGIVLHQRGLFTLHASAVATGDGGVAAFIGSKGMGKSTTAAALHRRGHSIVTDDVLALEPGIPGGAPNVIPGFPQLKLWPNAAEAALGDDPTRLPKLDPRAEKRARRVRDGFERRLLPLRCIYVLDYDADLHEETPAQITPMSLQEAFKALTAHSYAVGFMREEAGPSHLHHCTQLAGSVPVRRLTRLPSLDHLSDVARCVEEDVTQCGAGDACAPSPNDQGARASTLAPPALATA